MKIGIFFGGQSREREISFAGGRTVFDNLNKSLFEAIPIFIDSIGNFILLDWAHIYKGTIRDFYPPVSHIPQEHQHFQIYIESLGKISDKEINDIATKVGRKLNPEELPKLMDMAFLALHGAYGEDGNIQGILDWYGIPYTGSGILASAIGIDKAAQKQLLAAYQFPAPKSRIISIGEWENADYEKLFSAIKKELGFPLVVKSPHQGSSIGVSVLKDDDTDSFTTAVNKSFFINEIDLKWWASLSEELQRNEIIKLTDIREGVGLPALLDDELIYWPDELWTKLNEFAKNKTHVKLSAMHIEQHVLIESFIDGMEFSCIVIEDEHGEPLALPPTQIIKYSQLFDYRSKYLPGMSRKITPIKAENEQIEKIRKEACRLFKSIHCQVYARIDGFLTENGEVFLNDPNTTSGMLPSSFFFHQAAEIGLNPSQFLTYIIATSLRQRLNEGKNTYHLRKKIEQLNHSIISQNQESNERLKVGVFMGGFSSERHISVESGRNIYEKLSSSEKYLPIPIFLTGNEDNHQLYLLPINMMLKDNADDIREKVEHFANNSHPILEKIKEETKTIRARYTAGHTLSFKQISYEELPQYIDLAFIALHGRPGEDGAVQSQLEKLNIPYNGSDVASSQLTINKFETNEMLMKHGIMVAQHALIEQSDWRKSVEKCIAEIEQKFSYPFIAKPADDGCSSAVKKIKNKEELIAFAEMIFRDTIEFPNKEAQILRLKSNEEFPQKRHFLIEELIEKKGAKHFLEITGGLLTHWSDKGEIVYEIFEPSEALASGEVLSLEEKFLAGEGQNITPARFDANPAMNTKISQAVRKELEKTARVLNVQAYARIDAFVRIYDDRTETIIIEVNSLPGMTPATCIFHQTAINNYKPYDFIDKILAFGQQRVKQQKTSTTEDTMR